MKTYLLLCTAFVLISPTLRAQTHGGQPFLAESPVSFYAHIRPDRNPGRPAIVIYVDRHSREDMRVEIRNERKRTVYEGLIAPSKFAGRIDVSDLPYGIYKVELSTRSARYSQSFRIEPPDTRRITMRPEVIVEGELAKH